MILKYLKAREWGLIAICAAFIVAGVWLDLEIPDHMFAITNLIQTGGTVDQVMNEGWVMLALALGSLLTTLVVGYIAAYVAASLSKRLRSMEFSKVQSFSVNEINKFSTASLITRATNDITQVQMAFAMGLQLVIKITDPRRMGDHQDLREKLAMDHLHRRCHRGIGRRHHLY